MTSVLRFFSITFLLTAVLGIHPSFAAFVLPERPQAHVNDYAGALPAGAQTKLEERFVQFERTTGHQAAVAIFSSIEGEDIQDLTTRLFQKWGLGSKKENDGVLLVVSIAERALRIEVGYGLEAKLPDALAGRIIQNDMVPFLKQNQLATAILVFEKRLEEIFIEGKEIAPQQAPRRSSKGLLFFVIVVLIFLLLSRGGGGGTTIGPGGIRRRRSALPFIFLGGGGGWGGGGFGGGGGWGGGGGLSGGGGASGRW